MQSAAAACGVTLSKSQVHNDFTAGAPRHDVKAYLAWRMANRELGRTVESRIDRPQTSAQDSPEGADAGADAGPGGAAPSTPPGSANADQVDEDTSAFRADRARNERIKADRAELELEQLRGELVSVRDVEQLEQTAGRITRDRMLMVPPRVAASLQALVISHVPEQLRSEVAKHLPLHAIEQLLENAQRDALNEAAKAIEEARRDDDDEAEDPA